MGSMPGLAGAVSVVYCVSDSAQLGSVLTGANDGASVPIDIRIRQGTYHIGSTSYSFIAPTTIRGGYSDIDCTVRNANPYNTVIDMSGGYLSLAQPKGPSRAALTIDGVTIRNGSTVRLRSGTGHEFSNDQGDMTIRRTRFTNLAGAAAKDTIELLVYTGSGLLENVLFDHIASSAFPYCPLSELVDGAGAQFNMNFVTADFGGQVCLYGGGSNVTTNYFAVSNSIFWHIGYGLPELVIYNGNGTSNVYAQYQYTLAINAYDQDGKVQNIYGGFAADPKWLDPANGDYGLGVGSPALNAGASNGLLGLPTNDMIGQARNLGANPDMGALESNGSTVPTYIVSNTADSGAGSLRQAIIDANANAQDPGEIVFQLPGGCPQVIAPTAPLPDIVSPVRISGYSQYGSAANADASYFYPTLCVLLKPAATLGYALRVPASAGTGALDVSGLGFGNFLQPVAILGGTRHRIAGNQFGGNYYGTSLPGAGINAIVVAGLGYGSDLMIGGPSPGERNMISGAADGSGVQIQSSVLPDPGGHCQIVNNIIGANQNFSSAVPNQWGINLSGNNCLVQDNRIVGNTYDGIWINGGSSNTVRRNVIGIASDGGPLGLNAGWGVRVSGSGNVIGAAADAPGLSGTLDANTIAYMAKGGIAVIGVDMVLRNTMRDNLIANNGVGGQAPAIDLGADGSTANDATDADNGPNLLLNYPALTAVKYTYGFPAAGEQDVYAYLYGKMSGAPGLYRIDAYFYQGYCQYGQRGQAQAYLGSWNAVIDAGGSSAAFNYQVQLPNVAANAAVSFTATDSTGNTSEFGACYPLAKAVIGDDIFNDDFELF